MMHTRAPLILAVLSVLAAAPAWGDAVVLSSTAPGMAVGRVLADDETVRLPAATLTTLLLADGRVLKLDGPVEGKAADLGGGAQTAALGGGGLGGLDVSALGGTRGEVAAVSPPPPADRVAVDFSRPGTWCVSPSAQVTAAGDGVIEDVGGGRRAGMSAGQSWPMELPAADGATYVVHGGAAAPVVIGFRVIDGPPDGTYAYRLARAGCLAQVGPYLREAGRRTTAFSLSLATDRGQTPRYAIGEPVTLILQTNRPALLACDLVKDGAATQLFPRWLPMADHQELRVPGDQAAVAVAATPPPGMGELRCRAIDAAASVTLPPVERMEEAALPEASSASAHLFIRVQ